MRCFSGCKCVITSIIASVILGIVTAILNATAVITVGTGFLWAAFGIAIGFLAVLLIISRLHRSEEIRECERRIVPSVLAGILGTVLVSLILLAVGFAAASIIGSIFTGVLILFFSLLVTTSACLVKCKIGIDVCDD